MTNLQEKFDAQTSALLAPLNAIVGAQSAEAQGMMAIAAAIRAIGACMCEGIAATIPDGSEEPQEPPPGPNEPPPDGCVHLERVQRVITWQNQGKLTFDGQLCTLWAPLFSYMAGLQGWRPYRALENGRRAHIQEFAGHSILYCITWNFTGGEIPLRVFRDVSSNYDAMANTQTGLPLTPGATGSYSEDFAAASTPGNPATDRYIQFIFAFPSNNMPPLNAFLRYHAMG